MGAHARLSPSAAYRWLRCPGSVEYCADVEDTSSIYAAEGTFAHEVRDDCLTLGLDVEDFVGRKGKVEGFEFEVKEEWVGWIQPGIDAIRDIGGTLYVEAKVDWSYWGTDRPKKEFGTLDSAIVRKRRLYVIDFKFGAGVPVEVEGNEQLQIYALGAYETYGRPDVDEVVLVIDQPRVASKWSEWKISLSDLKRFGKRLRKGAAATYEKDAPLIAGAIQCQFCPKAAECPELARYNLEVIGKKFSNLDDMVDLGLTEFRLPNIERLDVEHRSLIVLNAALVRKWLDAVHEETLADALAGRPTPGLKAVEGRNGARFWIDEERVDARLEKYLGEERFTKKLKSPTQVEEIAPPEVMERLAKFIDQSRGKPSLVPVESKRKAIAPTSSKFKNLDERYENHGR